jgi:hypothetical protein
MTNSPPVRKTLPEDAVRRVRDRRRDWVMIVFCTAISAALFVLAFARASA